MEDYESNDLFFLPSVKQPWVSENRYVILKKKYYCWIIVWMNLALSSANIFSHIETVWFVLWKFSVVSVFQYFFFFSAEHQEVLEEFKEGVRKFAGK